MNFLDYNSVFRISFRPNYNSELPLDGYSVALIGRLSKRANVFKKKIEELGGNYATTIDKSVDVIISTQGNS